MDVAGGLSLVQTILQLLDSTVWKETQSVLGVKSQLHKLKRTMSTIDAILRDAEEQKRLHHSCSSYSELDRLERLKEALYQADDLFDEVTTLAHRKKLMPGNNFSKEVSLFFSQFNQLRSSVNWSREIKTIRERLDDVVNDHQLAGGFRHSVVLEDGRVRNNPRETHSYVNLENDVIIGRDDDKRSLIDMLLDTNVEENVSVVTIVGIGGLGKTTLAQLVYNDDMIKKKFPLKMWVCVTEDFNVKMLAGQIFAAATNQAGPSDRLTMDQLQKKVREALDGNKFLLILDDVWNENSEEWQKMKTLLVGGGRGSRVLVTSRSKKVADVVGSCKTQELKGLSDDEFLALFQKKALKPEEYPMKPQLVDIGKEVVRKCANVPLAIRVVGSLLRGQGESKWENLKNTDMANIIQDEANGIVSVLKISYNYLPFYLKSCFSYCAVFPKGYKISKVNLIRLWMAQGFIMPLNGESFEDAGEDYFKQLLQRCFFQDVELAEGTTDEIKSCKMHDLVHGLSKEVAGTEILSCNYNTQCFTEKTRHVFLDRSTPEDLFDNLIEMKRTRTFLNNVGFFYVKGLIEKLSKMKYLRALSFNEVCLGAGKLLSAICKLLHLRYLDLSYNNGIFVLPSSITNLYNLQTLKLYECENLVRLPMELGKLVNLRHLDIYGCSRLTCMPPGMNSMTLLQNLTGFVVGGTSSVRHRGSAGFGELVNLENFTSHSEILEISIQQGVRYNIVEAREEGFLLKSQNLRKVKYLWNISEDGKNDSVIEALLQSLQPHSYLRRLELLKYPGVRLPMWMINLKSCLPKLVQIEIRDCKRLEYLPVMSQLHHLKVLILYVLDEVEYVESGSSNIIRGNDNGDLVFFPSLEMLQFYNMPKLKGWWKSESEPGKRETPQAPMLSHLQIVDCSNLTTLFPCHPEYNGVLGSSMNLKSCLPNVVEIEIRNCERLEHLPLMSQLRHLKVLELEGLNEVEYMESSSNNSGNELVFFPSLEKLVLKKMRKLKKWWKSSETESESGESETPQAPLLSHLKVVGCPKLTTFPFCPKLQELVLHSFNEALGPVMRETTHALSSSSLCSNNGHQEEEGRQGRLRDVFIDNAGYLNSLPNHSNLRIAFDSTLERLTTGEMGKVCRSGRLSSLRSLVIENCFKLKSISGRGVWDHFTALQSLTLYGLDELELKDEDDVTSNSNSGCINEGTDAEMPWRYLAPTLHSLQLWQLPKVVKLPKGIGCLSSLQSLSIMSCPNLKRMPEEICLLTSLTKLDIWGCSLELKKRCENPNGTDWPNIQHIPNIMVTSIPDSNHCQKNCFHQ